MTSTRNRSIRRGCHISITIFITECASWHKQSAVCVYCFFSLFIFIVVVIAVECDTCTTCQCLSHKNGREFNLSGLGDRHVQRVQLGKNSTNTNRTVHQTIFGTSLRNKKNWIYPCPVSFENFPRFFHFCLRNFTIFSTKLYFVCYCIVLFFQ